MSVEVLGFGHQNAVLLIVHVYEMVVGHLDVVVIAAVRSYLRSL